MDISGQTLRHPVGAVNRATWVFLTIAWVAMTLGVLLIASLVQRWKTQDRLREMRERRLWYHLSSPHHEG